MFVVRPLFVHKTPLPAIRKSLLFPDRNVALGSIVRCGVRAIFAGALWQIAVAPSARITGVFVTISLAFFWFWFSPSKIRVCNGRHLFVLGTVRCFELKGVDQVVSGVGVCSWNARGAG